MIQAVWSILGELAPWLLLGAAVSGLLHALLPEGFVHRNLRGRAGVLKAVLLGVPLPLCSCGVIPAGVGLKRDGASDGAAVAFLVATPQTGVDSVLVSASFLGWPFALFKVAAALLTGVVAGFTVDALSPATDAPVATHRDAAPTGPAWRRALDHADEVVGTIWGWLVVGVLVSAALQVFLPADALAGSWAATPLVASLLVLVGSLPLYVCATASVPIAAGLLHAGLPPSAALVFLMAGPASNVATVGAVHRTFGGRVLAAYVGVVAAGSLGLGLAFDAILPTAAVVAHVHEHTGPVASVAAVVLLLLFVRYATLDLRSWWRSRTPVAPSALELGVEGMTCGGCVRRVDAAVRAVDGVQDVAVSLEEATVRVTGAASLETVREAVRAAGFRPSLNG